MKKIVSNFALAGLLFITPFAFGGETYESEEAKFKVTFPGEFEVEKEVDEDGNTTFALSCVYGDMILIGNAYIFTEEVSEDDNMVSEIEASIRVANSFGSKFNGKKVSLWTVGEDMGMINPLKASGELKGYIGNYYVIIQGAYQYQFVILGGKKTFDYTVESRFINSFEILP